MIARIVHPDGDSTSYIWRPEYLDAQAAAKRIRPDYLIRNSRRREGGYASIASHLPHASKLTAVEPVNSTAAQADPIEFRQS